MGRVCVIYNIPAPSPPPKLPTYQLALSGGVAKTQSFLLPQLPIKKYSFLPTGAGHQHFSYLPTLNLVKEAKFRWMQPKGQQIPFSTQHPRQKGKKLFTRTERSKILPKYTEIIYLKQRAEKFKSQNALKNNSFF